MTANEVVLSSDLNTDAAIANAIEFFRVSSEPHALLWLDVMHRVFGIDAFADALQRYDHALGTEPENLRLLRVFRRIAYRDNPVTLEDLEAVTHRSDRIIVSALYCDQLGIPPSFPRVLAKAVTAGGYYLTHALLAWVWMQKYGDGLTLPGVLVDEIYRANAAIVNADPAAVSDMRLEAAAFLCLAGKRALIDDGFLRSVLRQQNTDGGWGSARDDGDGSDWHSTVLGLLFLLYQTRPERTGYRDV